MDKHNTWNLFGVVPESKIPFVFHIQSEKKSVKSHELVYADFIVMHIAMPTAKGTVAI